MLDRHLEPYAAPIEPTNAHFGIKIKYINIIEVPVNTQR